ncbi:MAG: MFS transporter [bacterium]|nr:MFS transporter [bacterium]
MKLFKAYPIQFWKLCFACLIFFSSFTMVIPDLPILLDAIGGKKYNWLIIPSFAIIALISRPYSGKLSDQIGRVRVMCIGAVVTTLACFFYIFIPVALLFFFNRGFHGICAGFTPTGFTAYADDVVPLEKRGEAMGIVGICNNIGNAIGWVIGSKCTSLFGINAMFQIASLLGFISLLLFMTLKEHSVIKQKFKWNMLKLRKDELFESKVLIPGIVLLLTAFSSGGILALIADFTLHVGIGNKGAYMAIYILSSLVVRFLAGRWSDRYGRKKIALYGSIALGISMLVLAYTVGTNLYILSSVLFGIGFGLISPSLFAWTVDLSEEGKKGKAVGTLFIFLELGIILGSSVCGLIYNNHFQNFKIAFIICAMLAFSASFFVIDRSSPKNHKIKS